MTTVTVPTLTAAEIRDIEARAHELRAQAFAGYLSRVVHFFARSLRQVTTCPSCARPLRG